MATSVSYLPFWRLQDKFTDLSERIRDVQERNKKMDRPRSQFLKHLQPWARSRANAVSDDSSAHVCRTQLAASCKAFRTRSWVPLPPETVLTSTVIRCRPVSAKADLRKIICRSSSSEGVQRPRSVPASAYSRHMRAFQKHGEEEHNFDSTSPDQDEHLESYQLNAQTKQNPAAKVTHGREIEPAQNDDICSSSGIESTCSDNDNDDGECADDGREVINANLIATMCSHEYSASVGEARCIEKSLRPERVNFLEPVQIATNVWDFDAQRLYIPVYDYHSPLPERFDQVDFKQLCEHCVSWRSVVKDGTDDEDPLINNLADRLSEIAKLESDTVKLERSKREKHKKSNSKGKKPREKVTDRTCCSECLRPACCGACVERSPRKLSSPDISQTTGLSPYRAYTRSTPRESETSDTILKSSSMSVSRPRSSSNSYTSSSTNSKSVTHSITRLGRTTSTQRYVTRAQTSKPKSKETARALTPTRHTPYSACTQQIPTKHTTYSSCTQPIPTKPSLLTFSAINLDTRKYKGYGRNGLLPGKSFASQRKNSLTKRREHGIATVSLRYSYDSSRFSAS